MGKVEEINPILDDSAIDFRRAMRKDHGADKKEQVQTLLVVGNPLSDAVELCFAHNSWHAHVPFTPQIGNRKAGAAHFETKVESVFVAF